MKRNLFNLIQKQLDIAYQCPEIRNEVKEILRKPANTIAVTFPVKLSDGSFHVFDGYRVQHNDIAGPYKGGLRFHKNVDLDECKALASWMTIKCALQRLPYGGGKGGLSIDPYDYSENDLKLISKGFSRKLCRFIGPNDDIPAPDMGTNAKIMDWMTAEYQSMNRNDRHNFGAFTGKSIDYNGSAGRTEATGYGVMLCAKKWAEHHNIDLNNKTFIIQGFGNVGYHAALFMTQIGMKLIAVGDHTGYIKNDSGINVDDLHQHVMIHRGVKSFDDFNSDIEVINKNDFWATKCDICIPAALELQIDSDIANLLDCSLIVEGANGPTDDEADDILNKRNIMIIPDILANSGGVVVSYYEWVQNKTSDHWLKEDVLKKLENKMNNTFDRVYDFSVKNNVSMRYAAYVSSILHLQNLYEIKGKF